MKKVKVMLLSLALFAVVGGALAFKAKFKETYCYTSAFFISGQYTCTNNAQIVTSCWTTPVANVTHAAIATQSYCTTAPVLDDENQLTCQLEGQPRLTCPVQTTTLIPD